MNKQSVNAYLAELMGYEVVFIPEGQDCVHIICETGTRVAFNIFTSASDLNAVIDKFQEDAANVLMKLASMCGLAMCAVVGQEEAVNRMQGATNHISRAENSSWKKETVQ